MNYPKPFCCVMCVLSVMCAGMALSGCETRVVKQSGWGQWLDEIERRNAAASSRVDEDEGWALGGEEEETSFIDGGVWAIAVRVFQGPDHVGAAEAERNALVKRTSSADWWVQAGGESSVLYYGKYEGPQDEQALADRKAIRRAISRGEIVSDSTLRGALVPVELGMAAGDRMGFDLRSVTNEDLVYSLQVGFYESENKQEARDAAERAAAALRADGEEAYYAHGPNISMITVGTFAAEDAQVVDGRVVTSEAVRELQERFPHNMGNGRTLLETRGNRKVPQSSFLIRIP